MSHQNFWARNERRLTVVDRGYLSQIKTFKTVKMSYSTEIKIEC